MSEIAGGFAQPGSTSMDFSGANVENRAVYQGALRWFSLDQPVGMGPGHSVPVKCYSL